MRIPLHPALMFKNELVHEVSPNLGEETWCDVPIDVAEKNVPSVDWARYLVSFIEKPSGHFNACKMERKNESVQLLKPNACWIELEISLRV